MNGPHIRYLQALASDVASDAESDVANDVESYVANDAESDVASDVAMQFD